MNTHIFHPLRRRLGATAAAALTLIASACSGSLADDPGLTPDVPADDAAPTDSILRFPTIADLESLTTADLPGDFAGYELTDLSYECVDTIELRALRLNVTAGLSNPAGQKRTLTFTADVGPELVSVEYYPCSEMFPPSYNMDTRFYPHVERYRNYSDGSRIGPDLFYDYGHFFGIYTTTYNVGVLSGYLEFTQEKYGIWDENGNINSKRDYYKDGIYYFYAETEARFNLNTTVILEDGREYHGTDLLPINPIEGHRIYEDYLNFSILNGLNDFNKCRPSRLIDDPDGILSMCIDVPDVSPTPFPYDTESRRVGFYYGELLDLMDYTTDFASSAVVDDDWDHPSDYKYCNNIRFGSIIVDVYAEYMVIDGRIIHFREMFKDYIGVPYFVPVPQISKVSDGYLIHLQIDEYMYNEHIRGVRDIHIKTYYGSPRVIDLSGGSWNVPASVQPDAAVSSRSSESDGCCPRPDGTYVKVDRRLPSSIESVKQSRTINRSAL